jgi:DNA-binding GntR family transcriptional regulator
VGDIGRARFVLESAGIRAWAEAGDEPRERVRTALKQFAAVATDGADPLAMSTAHLAIHSSLVALTGSERLIATADAILGEARLALARVDRLRQDAKQQVTSHRRLVRLIERGDPDEAIEELRRHLAGAEESLLEAIGHLEGVAGSTV